MSGEHNEGEHGMQPAFVIYDDDKDSFGRLGLMQSVQLKRWFSMAWE